MKYPRRPVVLFALAFVLSFAAQVSAQQSPAVVGSTVSGRVICADTNAPARFAKVLLKSTKPDHAGEDFVKILQDNMRKAAAKAAAKSGQPAAPPKPLTEERKRAMAAAAKAMNQATDMMNSSTVGLDGLYSFAGVKPGIYYVHAVFAGYIDPLSQFSDEDFASTDPAIRARIAQIPTITVNGSDAAHVDLRLERGGAVSGRVLFDDGNPAVGWILSVIKPDTPSDTPNDGSDAARALMAQALALSGGAQVSRTDDLGHYRISGLAAGNYAVLATLVATPIGISATNIGDGGSNIHIAVYSGNTFNRANAKPIAIAAGKELSGVDITIPARSLHNVIGHVYAKSDNHTLNVGDVALTSKENPALHLKAAIRDDGSFHFEYLPGGVTYTLTVEDAADGRTTGCACKFMGIHIPKQEILRKYGTDTMDVALGDVDIETVRLTVSQTDWKPPVKNPGDAAISPGDALNGLFGGASGDSKDSNDKPKP